VRETISSSLRMRTLKDLALFLFDPLSLHAFCNSQTNGFFLLFFAFAFAKQTDKQRDIQTKKLRDEKLQKTEKSKKSF